LPEAEARTVEVHLVDCEACRLKLKELRELKAMLEDRALWRARARDSGMGLIAEDGTSCLTAAEMLLALEGKASERAEKHLSSCEGCTHDVLAIEESTEEQATGRLGKADPELLEVLRSVGKQASDDVLAPIIVIPSAEQGSKRAPKRIAPRHPSKRITAAEISTRRRRPRNVTVAGGIFTFAAAAAAAVIVGLLISQNGPQDQPSSGETKQTAKVTAPAVPTEKPRVTPEAPRSQPEKPAVDEPVDAPEPQSPFETTPETPEVAPQEKPETPAPATQADAPKEQPKKTETPHEPLPLEVAVADDGARIELDLSRLSGNVAIRNAGAAETDKWAKLAHKDGHVELKPGDRIRSTQGAFLSLDQGTYELSLAPKSELVIRAAAHGPVLGLTDGRVLCEVEKLPTDKHLVVATNAADFECTGTVFSVAADSQKAVCAVEEGTVVCRGQTGDPRPLGAGYALTVTRGAAPGEPKPMAANADAWAHGVRPDRDVVYAATFDRGDLEGFTGETTDVGAFRGVGRSLLFAPIDAKTNQFWGLAARAPKGRIKSFKPTLDMRLQFSIWLEKPSHVLLQVLNERQNKYFKRDFGTQPAERWVTLTVPVMDLESYYDPGKSPMREADLISEVEVFTGDPGDTWKALLDDVIVYRKRYR
jgi:hypothetical protein